VTEIGTNAALGKEHTLAGSVVRVGKQWSVAKSNGPNHLIVWGKTTEEGPNDEMFDHYLEAK
jgi:hypothetical protein